jgi:O-antigen ligase
MSEVGCSTKVNRPQRNPLSFAYAGVLLFFLVYYSRPNDWVPSLRTFPFAKVAAFFAIAGFLSTLALRGKQMLEPITRSRELKGLVVLFLYMWFTIPTAIWRGGSFQVLISDYWKVIAMTLLISATAISISRLRKLLYLSTASMTLMCALAIHSYWLGELASGRVEGPLQGVFANPNELALNTVVLMPICIALMLLANNPFSRLCWAAGVAIMGLGIVVTFSRGGFLALVAAGLVIVWEFGLKGRRASIFALAGVSVLLVVAWLVPAGYGVRLKTITNPETDETGSAQQREFLLRRSLEVTLQRPLLGVGPGNFPEASGVWRGAHNTYTQLSAEAGIPALLLFLWIFRRTFARINRTIPLAAHNRQVHLLAQGMRASLVAMAVGAFFYDGAYHFFFYFPIAYTVVLSRIAEQDPDSAELASSPARKELSGEKLSLPRPGVRGYRASW